MKAREKILARAPFQVCPFPVMLRNVLIRKEGRHWIYDYDSFAIEREVIAFVIRQGVRFTGQQVRFLRGVLWKNQRDFAKLFGVSHVAVHKWESARSDYPSMDINIERVLRLHLMKELKMPPGECSRLALMELRQEVPAECVLDASRFPSKKKKAG
jgi:hypothetical protein